MKLTKAQYRILKFIRDWNDRNDGGAAVVGRGMEGTNMNDEPVAVRLEKRGLLEQGQDEWTGEPKFWINDEGRKALA